MTFLLVVDNDNMINRILGPCGCALLYIRLAMYTFLQLSQYIEVYTDRDRIVYIYPPDLA